MPNSVNEGFFLVIKGASSRQLNDTPQLIMCVFQEATTRKRCIWETILLSVKLKAYLEFFLNRRNREET